ncbi:TPA: hypothetical protein QDA71_002453 [Burkholderia vietnamiensis]|uniref:hypothetical protein n=1 Tax=Burkholderia TaxID=32008 RepID=UPI00075B0F76|nr:MULTISPECIES: hypothetical protein [Burkholderia]KVS26811.1 hypothetical protein WK34_13615 [Burkholderia vietnamiensis]MBR8014115.1 hypothetical protein [Burkholderia vietnamiensis]HDR8945460.1 hypothetical protein [Burkholderia vietnamiensis]HDR9040798.1 hypothetical protein [Burkholderia vietnamiensis]HDR9195798.1 hypothetical protein [Burkholderia vietnamiensis]
MARVIFSSTRAINDEVARLVRDGWVFQAKGRGKHAKVFAPNGRVLSIPGSTSNRNALQDLRHRAQRLAALPALGAK